jgi:hypothetical protein
MDLRLAFRSPPVGGVEGGGPSRVAVSSARPLGGQFVTEVTDR